MRIIAGSARGKLLRTPPGLHTRPTTDRVKESMFSIIQFRLSQARVLDLFAGSGQLGLECLSRGAAHCLFCDNDRAALRVLRGNIEACGFSGRSTVAAGDWRAAVCGAGRAAYDVILLDPPYGGTVLENVLSAVAQFDILAARGIIVCESAREDVFALPESPYRLLKTYRYGAIALTTLTREEA